MSSRSSHASPLPAVLSFTGLASFATGTATLGIFFVTERSYVFSAREQYALGLLVGVTYMLGALLASPARRSLARLGLSARGILALESLAMAVLMCVPLCTRSAAALFVVLGIYAPLTGLFWPIVEGYVSGGRRAGELRTAIGRFNMVWSATLLPAFLCLSPLMQRSAALVFLAIVLAHLASALFLLHFQPEPGEHEDENAHPVPVGYRELLRVHRVLHAMGYLVSYALSPTLPTLLARLGVAGEWQSIVAATWLAARVVTFATLERWHGWHGRWSVAVAGALLVLAGFGLTVLASGLGQAAFAAVVLGLLAFGAGLAALYTAALYYVLEVGGSEGGGSHEALIGLGYSLGPLCGLLVCGLESGGLVSAERREGALVLVVFVLALCAVLWAWSRRHAPRPRS